MIPFGKQALVAATLVATAATGARAQARKCEFNDGKPFQVNSAKIYLRQATDAKSKEDERPKHLRDGVRVLTDNPDKIDNTVGRAFLLGRILVEWHRLDKNLAVRKRDAVGYTSNPTGDVSVLAAADSAFAIVEAAAPECADSTSKFRRQVGLGLYGDAVQLYQDGVNDEARAVAMRSLLILPRSPLTYNLLASIDQKEKNNASAVTNYLKSAELAGSDTSSIIVKTKRTALNVAAGIEFNQALTDSGASSKAHFKRATEIYRQYLKEVPNDAQAQALLAQSLTEIGDTAAVTEIFKEMLAAPDKYSDVQLYEAGNAAMSSRHTRDATQLYEAGLKKNPYSRDLIGNLSAAYFELGETDKLQPLAERLIHIDSLNPDSWKVMIAAYQSRVKKVTDPKVKRTMQDSLIEATKTFTDLPTRVKVTRFLREGAKFSLNGMVEIAAAKVEEAPAPAAPARPCKKGTTCPAPKPAAAAPAPAPAAPATVKLRFEFLDVTGKVLVSRDLSVGPIDAGSSKEFSVTGTQTGVVAYRYALAH
jgi:tetratricopeptide (TPR) repeat protein